MYQNIAIEEKFSLASQIIAGNISGWSSITVGQPLDMFKTKCQLNQSVSFMTLKKMIAESGFFSLYKGASSVYAFSGLIATVQFGIFQFVKSLQKKMKFINIEKNSNTQLLLSGGLTGLVCSFGYTPIQYTKIHCQIDNKAEGSMSRIFSIIYKQKLKGIRKLYTGNIWTLLKQVPGGAIYFGGFHIFLSKLSNKSRQNVTLNQHLIASSLASLTYIIYSYPLDTIKTNIQSGNKTLKQMLKQKFWKTQSFRLGFKISFFRGFVIDATALTVYQNVRNFITKKQIF